MKKFEITQEQIEQLSGISTFANECFKKWFPEAFKKPLEVGKWYKNPELGQALYFVTEIKNITIIAYGFNYKGKWCDNSNFAEINDVVKFYEATHQEVETTLITEAKKRGFIKGVLIRRTQSMLNDFGVQYASLDVPIFNDEFCYNENSLTIDGRVIFINGQWATIIETITKEEAEKLLNKKIV